MSSIKSQCGVHKKWNLRVPFNGNENVLSIILSLSGEIFINKQISGFCADIYLILELIEHKKIWGWSEK